MEEFSLRFESNWQEAEGALEDCILFRLHIHGVEEEEEKNGAESKWLVLSPPEGSCGPCQITIKFIQSQCKVCSIYVRSTAQVYELYSKSDLIDVKEHVCTVHGEIAIRNYDSNHRSENISKGPICPLSSISSLGEDGTQPPKKVQDHCKELIDRQILGGILEKPNYQSVQSDEDSWVQLKHPGSLEMYSCHQIKGASRFETLNDNKYVIVNQTSETSANEERQRIQGHTFHGLASVKNIHVDVHSREENIGTVSISRSCSIEEDWVAESIQDDNSILALSTKNVRPGRRLYEGAMEIVNSKPCMSLTIQFPSVQDKCVEVEEIRIHALPAMGVTDGVKIMDFNYPFGNSLGGSLLAMLVPNILEMSRSGLSQGQDALFVSPFHDSEESEFSEFDGNDESESSECGCSLYETSSSYQSMINIPAFVTKSAAPGGQYVPCENELSYSVFSSGDCSHEARGDIDKFENNTLGTFLNSNYDVDEICGNTREGGLQSEFLQLGEIGRVNEHMAHVWMEPEVKCSVQCSTREEECMVSVHEYHGQTMQHLVEHIQRLEAMCARIEVNLLMALDKMEKRIQLLESQHVLPGQSFKTGIDHTTSHVGINSSPSWSSPPSTSGIHKDQQKQISFLGAPSQSSSETTLVSTLNVSSDPIDCSSSCSPLSCHKLNKKTVCPVNCMDCAPHHLCAFLSAEESSQPKFSKSSSDVVLHELTSSSFDHWGLLNKAEDYLLNFSSEDLHHMQCASEVITTSEGESQTSVCEHTVTTKKNLCIDEAIASALAAFSASTHEEETSKCTGATCGTAPENMENEDIDYHDYLNFCSSGEVRFRTQEGIEPVLYGYKIEGNKDGNIAACDIDTTIKFDKEIASLKCKTELGVVTSRTNPAEMRYDARNAWPNMATSEPNWQKQYQPSDQGTSSMQNIKDCNLISGKVQSEITHERTFCVPCNGVHQKPKHGLSSMMTTMSSQKREVRQDNISIESDFARQFQHDSMNTDISSSSLFDASFTTYDAYTARKSWEALLYSHTQSGGKTVGLQTCTETKSSVNMSSLKHPHLLFFIEDEGLEDFIVPNPSSSPCTVSVNNYSPSEGMVAEPSPGFEGLLW